MSDAPSAGAARPTTRRQALEPTPAARRAGQGPGTDAEEVDWMWPVKGKVLAPFTEATKGMDIGGRKGAPVLAAAGGRVIYADQGLRGYGKLVIIRHNALALGLRAQRQPRREGAAGGAQGPEDRRDGLDRHRPGEAALRGARARASPSIRPSPTADVAAPSARRDPGA
jgi:hypothetical protein